jgi:hypothetical protein
MLQVQAIPPPPLPPPPLSVYVCCMFGVLGTDVRSSCLQGRLFTDWDISLASERFKSMHAHAQERCSFMLNKTVLLGARIQLNHKPELITLIDWIQSEPVPRYHFLFSVNYKPDYHCLKNMKINISFQWHQAYLSCEMIFAVLITIL